MVRFPRDDNRVPITGGVASGDGVTPTPIEVDAITGELLVKDANINKLLGLTTGQWDKVTLTQATLTDTYSFELASVPTKVITITYTDSGKGTISTVVLTNA